MGQIVNSSPSFLSQTHTASSKQHPYPSHTISRSADRLAVQKALWVRLSTALLPFSLRPTLPPPNNIHTHPTPSPDQQIVSQSKRHCGSDCQQLSFLSLSDPHCLLQITSTPIPHHLQISRSSRSPKGIVGQIVNSSPSFLSQTHTASSKPHPYPSHTISRSADRLAVQKTLWVRLSTALLPFSLRPTLPPPNNIHTHPTPSPDQQIVSQSKRHCGSDCQQLSFLSLSDPHCLLQTTSTTTPSPVSFSIPSGDEQIVLH